MTIVALVGDATTTTAVALAAGWLGDDAFVLEADRAGGSLAAWLDTPVSPSLATVVANTSASSDVGRLATIESMIHRSASGIRFLSAPVRARAASQAVEESAASVFPVVAATGRLVALADVGRHVPGDRTPVVLRSADTIVVCHRQDAFSANAAAARLERLVELVDSLAGLGAPLDLAVIGDRPFEPEEIASFVETSTAGVIRDWHALPEDPLAAAVLAGRTGVSARRLQRLPLMRSAAAMGSGIARRVLTDLDAPREPLIRTHEAGS